MMGYFSILCVTKGEPHAERFICSMEKAADRLGAELVVCVDGGAQVGTAGKLYRVHSKGYIESVLDECASYCKGNYILRIDDDEKLSPALIAWLGTGAYKASELWAFPRANLWGKEGQYIVNAPLWPDLQTRLTVRDKAGGRNFVHAGSPFGGGHQAPCAILHYKFLVKNYAQRLALAQGYEAAQSGAGTGHFKVFSLPEDVYEQIETREIGGGWA